MSKMTMRVKMNNHEDRNNAMVAFGRAGHPAWMESSGRDSGVEHFLCVTLHTSCFEPGFRKALEAAREALRDGAGEERA